MPERHETGAEQFTVLLLQRQAVFAQHALRLARVAAGGTRELEFIGHQFGDEARKGMQLVVAVHLERVEGTADFLHPLLQAHALALQRGFEFAKAGTQQLVVCLHAGQAVFQHAHLFVHAAALHQRLPGTPHQALEVRHADTQLRLAGVALGLARRFARGRARWRGHVLLDGLGRFEHARRRLFQGAGGPCVPAAVAQCIDPVEQRLHVLPRMQRRLFLAAQRKDHLVERGHGLVQ